MPSDHVFPPPDSPNSIPSPVLCNLMTLLCEATQKKFGGQSSHDCSFILNDGDIRIQLHGLESVCADEKQS
jgi:hypothetical protein